MEYGPARKTRKTRWHGSSSTSADSAISCRSLVKPSAGNISTRLTLPPVRTCECGEGSAADIDAAVKARVLPSQVAGAYSHARARYLYAAGETGAESILAALPCSKPWTMESRFGRAATSIFRWWRDIFYYHAGWAQLLLQSFRITRLRRWGQIIPLELSTADAGLEDCARFSDGKTPVVLKAREFTPLTA